MTLCWTAELDTKLMNLRASGMIFRDIGIVMGCSTSAALSRWNRIKGKVRPVEITHGDFKLADDARAKWYDLVLTIKRCNKVGLGVKVDMGLDQKHLVIWKDSAGTISVFNQDTMQIVLSETSP